MCSCRRLRTSMMWLRMHDKMEEKYNNMKRECNDAERECDMALQQARVDKDKMVRQARDAQQQAEAELKAQEKLFEQKEA